MQALSSHSGNGEVREGMDPSESNNSSADAESQQRQGNVRPRQMSITSDEVNYLIYRYLQECGFVHAAYTFSHESMLLLSGSSAASGQPQQTASWQRIADKTLPPGALITFLQKGLQYVGIEESLLQQQQENSKKSAKNKTAEANPNMDGDSSSSSSPADFSLLSTATIQALTRRNPPIQLTVPPAAAAAAVRARLAAEAEAARELQQQQILTEAAVATETAMGAVSNVSTGEAVDPALLARQAMAVSHAAAAAAMSQQLQLQQQQQQQQQIILSSQQQQFNPAASQNPALNSSGEAGGGTTSVETTVDMMKSGNKRVASGSKHGGKKQKTSDKATSETAAGGKVGSFASLEQAMAQLEAAKNNKAADSRSQSHLLPENDDTYPGNQQQRQALAQGVREPARPLHASNHDEELINGQIEHNFNGKKGQGLDENGSDHPFSGGRKTKSLIAPSSEGENEPDDDADDHLYAAKPEEILRLDKHESEVFMCAWNPVYTNLIATGSGDASARIWEMNNKHASAGLKRCTELPHGIESGDRKNKDVTTLEWSTDGTLLATGSYDGIARVWDRKGALIHTLRGHQGPIFSLKWNRMGNFLLSGSYDKTIIVWNVSAITAGGGGGVDSNANGYIEHQFKDHEAPALDVDWKDNTTFASCSTDRTVHIYRVDVDAPIKVYTGHTDEVNAVKWDPSGKYLASCSDDCTAKVWEVDSDRKDALRDFVSHDQEIYTVKWSPTGEGSPNPDKMPLLATASFDGSIRLWNIQDGSCFRFFDQHRDSVYSVAFSPSGDFLASGSLAGQLYIWNIADNEYVKSYKGKGDIFEVAWNKEETRVAACFSSNVVAVIDFDRTKAKRIPPSLPEPGTAADSETR